MFLFCHTNFQATHLRFVHWNIITFHQSRVSYWNHQVSHFHIYIKTSFEFTSFEQPKPGEFRLVQQHFRFFGTRVEIMVELFPV